MANKIEVRLVGEDGNVFAIIGRVAKALRRSGQNDLAKEWTDSAMKCGSYDEVLQLVFKYVDPT